MISENWKLGNPKGFSLIEIIVALIIASLFGTIFIQYMGSSLTKSSEPIIMVQEGFSLNQVMENITADYKKLLVIDSNPLATFKNYVEDGNDSDNDPYYGDYSVTTDYIIFNSGVEETDTSGDNLVLRITISSNNQSLTALFTK
ncbi:prepilin-type N-terminal cleavage/methylation domain-containing protein [Thermodesulfobacteriota bacterium]